MKVRELHILRIVSNPLKERDAEVVEGSEVLYQYYDAKLHKEGGRVVLWQLDDPSGVPEALFATGPQPRSLTDIGLYVISGAEDLGDDFTVENVADAIRIFMNLPSLRKLAVLSCYAARPLPGFDYEAPALAHTKQSTFPTVIAALCAELTARGYVGLKVSGWNSFITINRRRDTRIVDRERKDQTKHGRKATRYTNGEIDGLKKGKDRGIVIPSARRERKRYVMWTPDRGIVQISEKDWHDASFQKE
jgi:hypothetical protein